MGGLHITIESPLDSVRSGTDPNGKPWLVRMPADYGEVKRTVGADGDAVDVYLGPDAHIADRLSVWVVDQRDADTKAFDEHKVMLGFRDAKSARDTYLAGFSDGRGKDRIQGVTRMSFQEFKDRLKTHWKKPVSRNVKSASVNIVSAPYSSATCPCAGLCACTGYLGGSMTKEHEKAASNPQSVGFVTKILSAVLPGMSSADRIALMQDAAAQSAFEIGKASSLLEGEGIKQVEDLWDGPTDAGLTVGGGHGPGSSAPAGSVNVGPSQASSGNGAEHMERQYSDPTRQSGVQRATERLGRDIAGVRAAMKSFLAAFDSVGTQMTVMKSQMAALPDQASIADMVAKAVTTAVTEAVGTKFASLEQQVAKAMKAATVKAAAKDEEDDAEAREDEEGADFTAKAMNEAEEEGEEGEGEDRKEAAKSAAILRLQAKSRLKWASRRVFSARDLSEAGDAKAASQMLTLAEINLAKAAGYVEASKVVLGKAGNSSKAILAAVAKAKKDMPAKNQDVWPTSKAAEEPKQDLAKAIEQIQNAASGMGMLQASVGELMSALTNRNNGSAGGGSGALPPVFALAKAGAGAATAMETELVALRDNNVISHDDFDRSRDAIMRSRMGMPEDNIRALIARLPEQAQAVLTRTAA